MARLKHCPFCGGVAYFERHGANINGLPLKAAYVRCGTCFARTGRMLYDDHDIDGRQKAKQDAIDAWEMRCNNGQH